MAKNRGIESYKYLSSKESINHGSMANNCDSNDIDDKIDATISMVKRNMQEMSEIFETKQQGDSSRVNISRKICDSKNKPPDKQQENGDNEVGDDNSDYDVESFCSDDSFKESEVTNVTSRSSLSGCSSLLRTTSTYEKSQLDEIKRKPGKSSMQKELDLKGEDDMSLVESEMRYLSTGDGASERRQGGNRRNMSFSNEEIRRIERENQLLLRKIMSHQKPQNKAAKVQPVQARTCSSAINRKKLQRKIEEDNMLLLRRIQHTKSCAMSRTSTPGYRVTLT